MIIIKFSSILTKNRVNCHYIYHKLHVYFRCTFHMPWGWLSYYIFRCLSFDNLVKKNMKIWRTRSSNIYIFNSRRNAPPILVKTSNRTLYIHEYNRVYGSRFQCLVALEPMNQKKLNWYNFVMQHAILIFRQVLFSSASTSGFKSERIVRSLLYAFVANFKAFLKSFDAASLDKM